MPKLSPIELAADIVRSFVSSNSLPRGEVPALIQAMHAAVMKLAEGAESPAPVVEPAVPAVSIRKSLTPDYLICLEDGKRFKSLRRHLATLGLTPEQYREKWSLPASYPMVAPNYAAQRSALAKTIGLGQSRGKFIAQEPASFETDEAVAVEEGPEVVAVEVGAAPSASVETIEAAAPVSVPKRKAKAKAESEEAEAAPTDVVARKRGRPRKVIE